jgi:predicted nucleic acid-binding protein
MNPPLLLDACAVINLRAAGLWSEVASAMGHSLVITRQVARESLSTLGEEDEPEPIDLEQLEREGELEIHGLIGDEINAFVELARDLGDGEASTLAMASARGWLAATDDRRARKIAKRIDPPVAVLTTLELIRAWAQNAGASRAHLVEVVKRIRQGARYLPPDDEPDAEWWHGLLREEAA